ncbi:MAG: VTT domain-containing protein [Desulfovibrionaceae bacterium]
MSGSGNGNSGIKAALKGLVMLLGLGSLVWLARSLGLDDMLRDTAWFNEHVLGNGPLSIIIYIAVGTALTAVGMPRQLVCFLGGVAFGAFFGTLLGTLACGLGCLTCTGYARLLGRQSVSRLLGKRLSKADAFLKTDPFRMALTIRLIPVGSNLITNLAAGVSSIPLWPFVLGSTLGYVPQNLVFALFGGGMNAESRTGLLLSVGTSVVLLIASAWLGISVYRNYKAQADSLREMESE